MAMPDADFVAANYGELENIPDVTGKNVYILDFSFPRAVLLKIKELAKSLVVIDHHKTASEDLFGLDFCIFDMQHSGASLTHKYFFPDEEPHWMVGYVEDRDLWKFELPKSVEINAAIASYPLDFEVWDALWRTKSLGELAQEGSAILRYQHQVVGKAVSNAQEVIIRGHKVLIANSSVLHSEVANILSQDRPFGVVWSQQADGRYRYSLRNKPGSEFDVSSVAKLYGGGGHKHAAGFVTNSTIHFSPLKT